MKPNIKVLKDPLWICITGTDGAGKSSLIELLLKENTLFEGRKVKEVTIWDLFNLPEEEKYIFIRSKRHVDLYLKSLSPESRSFFLLHCIAQSIEMARKEGIEIALINAYWYKYMAAEIAYDGHFSSRVNLTSTLPVPDLVFSLKVSVETATNRKENFSAFESGFPKEINAEAFSTFQIKVHKAYNQIMSNINHCTLNGELPLAELKDQLVLELNKHM
jgi:thymidylate kinase